MREGPIVDEGKHQRLLPRWTGLNMTCLPCASGREGVSTTLPEGREPRNESSPRYRDAFRPATTTLKLGLDRIFQTGRSRSALIFEWLFLEVWSSGPGICHRRSLSSASVQDTDLSNRGGSSKTRDDHCVMDVLLVGSLKKDWLKNANLIARNPLNLQKIEGLAARCSLLFSENTS